MVYQNLHGKARAMVRRKFEEEVLTVLTVQKIEKEEPLPNSYLARTL